MKILALPREDSNPYQTLLYGEMRRRGAEISFLGGLTPSHGLNVLLLPLELAVRRLGGARIVHLHWLYIFGLYGSARFPFVRRISQAAFTVWLWTLRALGMKLVWTAHNVLTVFPTFTDDVRVIRQLASACDLVIVHSQSTLDEFAALGIVPRSSVVIPHGPFAPTVPDKSLRAPGVGSSPRRLLFFGKVRQYKGVDDLLAAFAALPADVDAQLTVAGECRDSTLRSALTALAARSSRRVVLHLERIPDDDVTRLIEDADVVVLPFRKITTSGSAMLALCHGRPLVVPDLVALANLPDDALVRYDGTIQGLTRVLTEIILADVAVLAKMSAAARSYCSAINWSEIAKTTLDQMHRIIGADLRNDSRSTTIPMELLEEKME